MEGVPTPRAGKLDNEGERIKRTKKKIKTRKRNKIQQRSKKQEEFVLGRRKRRSFTRAQEIVETNASQPYHSLTDIFTSVISFAAAMERTVFGNLTNDEVRDEKEQQKRKKPCFLPGESNGTQTT